MVILNAPARQTTPALLSGITLPNLGWVRVLPTIVPPMLLSAVASVAVTKATAGPFKSQETLGPVLALMLMNVPQTPTAVRTTATTPPAPFLARVMQATL